MVGNAAGIDQALQSQGSAHRGLPRSIQA
jgi:hypothetical protein